MTDFSPITVLIGRFDDLLARGLRQVVDGDPALRVVADDVDPLRMGVVLRGLAPRVAILDAEALHKLAEVAELTRLHPNTRLVLLATRPTAPECAQLLAFGASACLGRDTQARDVLSAVHLSARGLQLIPRAAQEILGARPEHSDLLTRREAEILPLLQHGDSNAQIAALLQISAETVRTHARSIFRKLGVSSRRELAAPAFTAPAPAEPAGEHAASRRLNVAARDRQRRYGSLHH